MAIGPAAFVVSPTAIETLTEVATKNVTNLVCYRDKAFARFQFVIEGDAVGGNTTLARLTLAGRIFADKFVDRPAAQCSVCETGQGDLGGGRSGVAKALPTWLKSDP